jgi:hypothetical protein
MLALFLLFVPVALLQAAQPENRVFAEGGTPVPPRKHTVIATFTWYDWWMARWENNEVVCRILVEHPGLPSSAEILNACGQTLHSAWKATKPCADLADSTGCRGMYLHAVRTFPGQRSQDVVLPAPQVWISLVNCNPGLTTNLCTTIPTLLLTGEDPLPTEMIIRIQGTMDGEPFSCSGNICTIPLHPTGTNGISLEFWGDSSRGDSTERYKALLRVVAGGDAPNPEDPSTTALTQSQWMVDVLSSQFRSGTLASCSDTWQVFPDAGGLPPWLSTPLNPDDLLSTHSYYYLAGMLISNGVVDASLCPNNGLSADKVADECGLQTAKPAVLEWQNQFDQQILTVSKDTGVPAQLMKNVFGRESQFWPGLYKSINEAGLGQLTEKGADALLMWNTDFFGRFCPGIFSAETCQKGFIFLKPEEQNMLRGALVSQVNAACPDCPLRVDLTRAGFSVRVFAESMLASCTQTARIVFNLTQRSPGLVSTYTDLWKFTLVNYNAGAGCLYDAAKRAWTGGRLVWDKVASNLDPACAPSADYVNSIAAGNQLTPTPTAWVFQGTSLPQPTYPTAGTRIAPTATLGVTATTLRTAAPTATATRSPTGPTPTATITPTPGNYPAPETATPGSYP